MLNYLGLVRGEDLERALVVRLPLAHSSDDTN